MMHIFDGSGDWNMVDSANLSGVLAGLGSLLDALDLLARLLACFLLDVLDLVDGFDCFDCCFFDSPLCCFFFCVVLLLDFLLGAADFATLVLVDACTTLKGSVGMVDLFNVKVPKLLVACTTLNWSTELDEVETAEVRRAVDGVAVAVGLEAWWTRVVCLVSNFCDPEERIVISISNSIVSFSTGT